MSDFVQVTTTVDDEKEAKKISKRLVEERLAGCVQIVGPIESTYWWKDDVENAEEWMGIIKTEESLYDRLEKKIKDIHPYETPEIVCTPISKGSDRYLEWLKNELKDDSRI